jgi:hypothetical protein
MAFKAVKQKRPAVHHKKRTGSHHRQNDKYLRHYWPYIPMLLIVGIGLLLNSLWSNTHAVLGAQSNLTASALTEATNRQRTVSGENSLKLSDELNQAAAAKAQDMVTENYWSHDSPSGKTPWQFIISSGYAYNEAGENLAYGFNDAASVLDAWMHSPEHRANVLDTDYSEVGFGIAQSPDFIGHGPETIIVAMYGAPSGFSVSATVPPHAVKGERAEPVTVSRVESFTASGSIALGITIGIATALVAFLVTRHARAWHRVLVRSESFVLHHPLLDITFVALATVAVLLSQAAGSIL